MQDILYKSSVFGEPRRVYDLPFGFNLSRQSEICYHFYSVSDPSAPLRAARAAKRISQLPGAFPFDGNASGELVSVLLLGLLPKENSKMVVEARTAQEKIDKAISDGMLDPGAPSLLMERILPFKGTPQSIADIAKDPTAIAVFVVVVSESHAPIAIVVLPSGIVAIHAAANTSPRIATWLDAKLKEWLK
ncbi:MAG: hypothetical protein ABWZ40_03210 [Caulobacterales bacterium]